MKTIAIVAGGDSSEWVISVKSAAQMKNWIDPSLYISYVVQIRQNNWVVLVNETEIPVDRNDFSFQLGDSKVTFDAVVMAIHGTPGEDGKLQSYFDMLNIPYTTCGVLCAALTFNKYACKIFLKEFEITTAKAVLIKQGQSINSKAIVEKLGLPCFVKPNEAGSSFGVTKVNDADSLQQAIEHALTEGNEVIIEEFIKGTEITQGLYKTRDGFDILPITEVVSKKEFFDYEAKYTTGMSEEITPARIAPELAEKCSLISSKIYEALGCKGIVRIDYIIRNNEFYFLEINTVPGMSPNSIIPQQIKAKGKTVTEVYNVILADILTSRA